MIFSDALIQDHPFGKAFEANFLEVVAKTVELEMNHASQVNFLLLKFVISLPYCLLNLLDFFGDHIILNLYSELSIFLIYIVSNIWGYIKPVS